MFQWDGQERNRDVMFRLMRRMRRLVIEAQGQSGVGASPGDPCGHACGEFQMLLSSVSSERKPHPSVDLIDNHSHYH